MGNGGSILGALAHVRLLEWKGEERGELGKIPRQIKSA